ncbi:MAG: hypothetical protein E7166_01660 [Firmicutes bacterium]|nr:hypothetical protein [Bacillota bacterium]
MDNIINIEEYRNPKFLLSKKIYGFTLILILLIIVLISLLFLKYDYHYKGIGVVSESDVIQTKINYTDSYKLLNSNKLNINKKNFSYTITNISIPTIENNIPYINVVIDVNNLRKINNSIVEFKIKYDSKYGFEIVKELILGKEK